MNGTALITGITGQDGHYLAASLLARGVRVVGTTRSLEGAAERLDPELAGRVTLAGWDMTDAERFAALLEEHRPAQIYNLAAFTSGEFMDREPERVTDINGIAVLRMLEAVRRVDPAIRFCQASSGEVFAASGVACQDEDTPRVPRSVYGAAKIYADSICRLYREKYGLFACSAHLFNHESPRRGPGFVTQKVVQAAVRIARGEQRELRLGNLSAARDWGFAGDYVEAMRRMLSAPAPRDYVVATGQAHSVAQLCEMAFGALGLDWRDHVAVDPLHYRAEPAVPVVGNAARARIELGWAPTMTFAALIAMMVDGARAD